MRTISAAAVTDAVAKLCIQANTHLPPDIVSALDRTRREEPWPLAKETLGLLWDNLELAEREELPVCQDTGMACVFVELGQEVHIQGDFEQAVHEGVRRGYGEGYLRKSIVGDPLRRVNTGDNTPAAITLRLIPGAAYLAKHALLRPIDQPNSDPFYAQLEEELLEEINALGIGPQGFGGRTTCLGLSIETAPTHVAGLPVAVNVSCHVTRRASSQL